MFPSFRTENRDDLANHGDSEANVGSNRSSQQQKTVIEGDFNTPRIPSPGSSPSSWTAQPGQETP